MIIVFNWKDKLPINMNELLAYYDLISEDNQLIVCPGIQLIPRLLGRKFKLCLQYYIPQLVPEVDYVMLNHERFKKQKSELKFIPEILDLKKTPIVCFSKFSEVENLSNYNSIWAYEPSDHIGSLAGVDLNCINTVIEQLKMAQFSRPYLYGGGVSPDNICKISKIADGVLIGERSTDINFLKSFDKLVTKSLF